MSLLLQISSQYPALSDAERKIADVLLGDPFAVRDLSITSMGKRCGVSQTTVNRFCNTLGFSGYIGFKRKLIEDLVSERTELADVHGDVEEGDSDALLIQKVFNLDIQAIRTTSENIDLDAFRRATDAVASGRMIGVFGVGSSLPVATDLYYRFLRLGLRCGFSSDSHMQAINAALLAPGDVAVAISYSGENQDTLDCVELANEAGATTLCVTSFTGSRLARSSSISLTTSARRSMWLNEAIPGRLAQLALFDALCVAVARNLRAESSPVAAQVEKAVARKRR
ncbi:MAG: MurR/RpiR family transcriptional regulator [Capsulimonadaceae bacterium]|nr:MurR/RpiR family transcriptional regulator [Capsulimonadaceae bacterium]